MTGTLPKIKGFDRQREPELRAGENGAIKCVSDYPQAEPIVIGLSTEALIKKAKAWRQ